MSISNFQLNIITEALNTLSPYHGFILTYDITEDQLDAIHNVFEQHHNFIDQTMCFDREQFEKDILAIRGDIEVSRVVSVMSYDHRWSQVCRAYTLRYDIHTGVKG